MGWSSLRRDCSTLHSSELRSKSSLHFPQTPSRVVLSSLSILFSSRSQAQDGSPQTVCWPVTLFLLLHNPATWASELGEWANCTKRGNSTYMNETMNTRKGSKNSTGIHSTREECLIPFQITGSRGRGDSWKSRVGTRPEEESWGTL